VGLIVAACVLVLILIRLHDRTALQRRLDAVRAAGYPVTFAELDAWYKDVPYGENAAEYVLDAIACLQTLEKERQQQLPWFNRDKMPARTEPLSDATVVGIVELLEKNQEALEYLHRAGVLQRSRYPIDLTKGHATLLPHLSDLRSMVRLLCLEAILHAERHEQVAAAKALVSALGVANTEAATPVLISQMVRQSGQGIALVALERLLNRTDFDEEHLAGLYETVATAYDPNAIARGFVGERCMVIAVLGDPRSTGLSFEPIVASEGPSLLQLHAARAVGLTDRLLAQYIAYVDRSLEALKLPPHKRLKAVGPLEREHSEMREAHPDLTWTMPTLARFLRNDLAHMTKLEVAGVALAIERYRLANDQLPDQLTDLLPQFLQSVPLDPYDGHPLRYRRLDPGFVVYSIGKDGIDDGGKEQPKKRRGQDEPNYDITFIVEH
jgi:hypothetical protein